jgi:hypothetical protein
LSPQILQPLPAASTALSEQIRLRGGANPAVYDALTTVMRYAALFRAVRQAVPGA